jgi:hypothetical protein
MSRKGCVGESDLVDLQCFSSGSASFGLAAGLRIQSAPLKFASGELAMLGQLTNIPTDTLIDMLYTILAGELAMSASDAAEIEQIQSELQRRGGAPNWSLGTVN